MQETQETKVGILGQENFLEEEMANHSSILAWEIPRTEEPRGLSSVGLQRVRHDCKHTRTLIPYMFKDLYRKWTHEVSSWPTLTQQREPVKLVNWITLVSTNRTNCISSVRTKQNQSRSHKALFAQTLLFPTWLSLSSHRYLFLVIYFSLSTST